jgi:alpha-tubulin suppressor-like RCC1 family protein
MTTKILGTQIEVGTIQTEQLSANVTVAFANSSQLAGLATSAALAEFATSLAPKITSVAISNSTFTVLDDAAVNVGGGYIVVTGANFQSGATVLIDTTPASSVSRINSTTLHVQVPSRPAATYNLYVTNPDGGTGIRVNAITYSADPAWVTTSPLTSRTRNTNINFNFSATSATSYAVANGSTLPAGTSLLANGYFYGTPTGAETDTTYNFDVVATDDELQDSSKTLSITITAFFPVLLYWFGQDNNGNSGTNSLSVRRSSPTQIGTLRNWSSNSANVTVASGIGSETAVVKNDGTLWSWGQNSLGRLGLGDSIARSSPVQVGTDTNWDSVSFGNNALYAVKKTGTLWFSGFGDGVDYPTPPAQQGFRSSMTQIGTISNWKQVNTSAVGGQVLAIRTDGTLWAWGGFHTSGELGLNSLITRSSPVQVGTDTNWKYVNMEGGGPGNNAMAIKTNGTLWGWGINTAGQLGLNDLISRSSPVQVGTGTNWSTISQSSYITTPTLAVKTDGTLWAWGGNTYGGLGIGNNTAANRRSSPVQLGALTNWKDASSSRLTAYAVKTDGTLWAWGLGNYGALGTNNTTAVYSPIQIGTGTTWDKIVVKGAAFGSAIGLTKEL